MQENNKFCLVTAQDRRNSKYICESLWILRQPMYEIVNSVT